MRKAGALFGILLVICLAVVDGVALLSTASAKDTLYSAGENIVRDNKVVGCRCPRNIGECICEWETPD